MRFLLLARARTTGLVRLLSDHAFDSRTAAVDAATVTAHTLDLCDDEVLAVDLDAAGPVLVLRVAIPVSTPAARPAPAAAPAPGLFSPSTPLPAPAFAPATAPAAGRQTIGAPGTPDDESQPAVRLQPRFPLFGADDERLEEDLSETLRRVARRMEADLTGPPGGEWGAADDTWDARTLDDYAMPDDTHLDGAREEGLVRGDTAALLLDRECPVMSDRPDMVDDIHTAGDSDDRDDTFGVDGAGEPDDLPEEAYTADPGMWETDDRDQQAVEVTYRLGAPLAETLDPEPPGETGPHDEPAPALEPAWEPEPYRASNIDFAIWVCADCVYQRTCRKAGIATPATCGTFQWRSH
jgi:hypothetical protein